MMPVAARLMGSDAAFNQARIFGKIKIRLLMSISRLPSRDKQTADSAIAIQRIIEINWTKCSKF
jgi:hypothetical protein